MLPDDSSTTIDHQPLVESAEPRRSRVIPLHNSDSSEEEEIQNNNDQSEGQAADHQAIADRVANGEVPVDVLQRQRGLAPMGAYVLTEQEAQREIANSVLFCFMDVLSIGAWLVCLVQNKGPCEKPLTAWYSINGLWACLSLSFMVWYSYTQLKNNFQTKRSIAITYAFESGYLLLSIWAWIILAQDDPGEQCQTNASGILELLVDMIILLYMRSLRLLSIVLFIVICGPLLLVCWYKNRPAPTENPEDIIKHLTRVKVEEFRALRAMNYRHAPTPRSSQSLASGLESDVDGDSSSSHLVVQNPYDGHGLDNEAVLDSCCICMEDFSESPDSQRAADNELGVSEQNVGVMVVLPCKSHFFHEVCISQWIYKQNACPICREEITLARLKAQKKEIAELLEQAANQQTFSRRNSSLQSDSSSALLSSNDNNDEKNAAKESTNYAIQ